MEKRKTTSKNFKDSVLCHLSKYKEAGEYEVELIYSVPSYFTLKDDAPQSIWIKIDKKPEEITEPLIEVTE